MPGSRHSSEKNNPQSHSPVDVVIFTAVKDELDAVLAVGNDWQELRDRGGFRYHRREVRGDRGSFTVAAAWIGEMGGQAAAMRGMPLLDELSPSCLAMCGICAGDPEKVALGDLIVANQLWPYGDGKQTADGFYHAMKLFPLDRRWGMDASFAADFIDLEALAESRPPTKERQTRWLLHALHAHQFDNGPAPADHTERKTSCPDYSTILKKALDKGLVRREGRTLALTNPGKDSVDEDALLYPDKLPCDKDFKVHVGAMATGSAVIEDPGIFRRLRTPNRHTIALDMEGAAIAELADRTNKQFLVVKAVQDFANGDKDDTFRSFGCRASAEFLFAFLEKHFEPENDRDDDERTRADIREFAHERGHEHPFLAKVERAAQARFPTAKMTKHRVEPPFVGLLQLEIETSGFSETQLVAALDQAITPDLVKRFAVLERPFRDDYPPLRSTIVYRGDAVASDLSVEARRKGIHLETFYAYQALFDLTKYLEWQTARLQADPIYPPAMYVDPPATYEVQGSRDRTKVDNALQYVLDLLRSADQPRFALVIGDFGAGKTFLLHELARRMVQEKHPVWPVLVEMHRLEKQTDLSALLAAHFTVADVPGYNFKAFQYMLNEGRITLLFDGFDELAGHVTYDAVTKHFETVLSATTGERAKVVLSSRRQYFLSDSQIKDGVEQAKLVLAEKAAHVPGFRFVVLDKFEPLQIRQYLRNALGNEQQADERYALINEVQDLLGLSENPRMLGFIVRIPEASLREAKRKEGTITAAKLYDLLVKDWLDFEHQRSLRISLRKGISRDALSAGMGELALSMWLSRIKHVQIEQLRDVVAAAMQRLGEPPLHPDVLGHMFASGSLLVREGEGRFSFVHRSVLEWFVARDAAKQVQEHDDSALLAADELSALMADFFSAMATREKAISWARGKLGAHEKGTGAKNATLVLQRLGQSFERLDFAGHDLRGQDFSGVDWRGADLRGANLEGATLVGANLSGANLVGARLYRTNLTNAKLVRARLGVADLRVARLSNADLMGAEGLDSVELFRTNFAAAKLPEGFDPPKVDLSGVASVLGQTVPMCAGSATFCYSVAWDPRGELLAAGFADGTVRIFDAVTGELLRVLAGHSKAALSVAFSPDGKTLASGSSDKSVRVWDSLSGRFLHALDGHSMAVSCVAFANDGKTLASGSHDKSVRVWDSISGRFLRALEGHSNAVSCVAFANDGKTLASGSHDQSVHVWDSLSGRFLRALEGHSNAVSCVAFSPDGKTLASGSSDKSVRVWDSVSGRFLRALEGHSNAVSCVAFSPDGKTLASGSSDKSVRVWDSLSGRFLRVLDGHSNAVSCVAFSPDGKTLASGSSDQSVRLWDSLSGRFLRALEAHSTGVWSVAFSPDGKTLASGSHDQSVRLWDSLSGRFLRALEGHSKAVLSVAFSPDGKALASGSDDNTIRLWDVLSGRQVRALEGHSKAVYCVTFSLGGKTITSGSYDNTLRLWDVLSGREIRALEAHMRAAYCVACSPDGKTITSGSDDNTLRLWDVLSGREIRALKGHSKAVLSVAFSPDGKTLASSSYDKSVRLWDSPSGRFLRALEGHSKAVWSVAFSPDGKTLASGSDDNSLRLWNVLSGTCVRVLKGSSSCVLSVQFSPDGQTIASGSLDGTIRLWDVASGRCLAILLATKDGWVAFTPDGHYKFGGNLGGSFWHLVGLCRFEVGEIDAFLPPDKQLRLPDDHQFVPTT